MLNKPLVISDPLSDLVAYTNGSVAIDTNYDSLHRLYLHWGFWPMGLAPTTNYGIAIWATNVSLNGFTGSARMLLAQIGSLEAAHNYLDGTSSRRKGYGLDFKFPADSFASWEGWWYMHDQPAEPAGDSAYIWRSDHFETYLFFKPDGGVAVPLKKVQWSWSGLAQQTSYGGIILSNSTAIEGMNINVTDFPTWTNTMLPGNLTNYNQWLSPFP